MLAEVIVDDSVIDHLAFGDYTDGFIISAVIIKKGRGKVQSYELSFPAAVTGQYL